ncbi:hypothetical protein CGU37_22375 [Pseudomonas fluorescens]|nr:hypothetical protein CGU36_23415 [Pseudomonas fluorescens]OZO46845.1 hypothetical protein CGU37_22375 [Pseudomonas fluorescens]TGY15856.1 hypothetical protein E5845_19850 [Pseudomonas fluorescens]
MSADNSARFNELAKQIIDLVVGACPLPVEINAETLNLPKGGISSAPSGFSGGFYNPSPEEEMLDSTLAWLFAEGFIRKDNTDYYTATLRTLKIYNSVPNAIAE